MGFSRFLDLINIVKDTSIRKNIMYQDFEEIDIFDDEAKAEINDLQKKYDKLSSDFRKLVDKNSRLERNIIDLKKTISIQTEQNYNLYNENIKLKVRLGETEVDNCSLVKQNEEHSKHIDSLETENMSLKGDLDAANKRIDILIKENQALNEIHDLYTSFLHDFYKDLLE